MIQRSCISLKNTLLAHYCVIFIAIIDTVVSQGAEKQDFTIVHTVFFIHLPTTSYISRERCGERTLRRNEKKINDMKKTYHVCLSAGDEIMFRDLEDYNRGFNCFALALHKTGSTGLVEAFMATHTHQVIQTSDPKEFMWHFRQPYSMYFNNKYQRDGRLGENQHFTLEVVGHHHKLAAMSYTLRNAVHHGVVSIPYAYPHCSANAIFRSEMGKFHKEDLLLECHYSKHIGRRAEYPDSYKMSESGVFLRETVLDIPQVEDLFISPRAFNYYMTRRSSEEWKEEQRKDGDGNLPVTLTEIENGIRLHSIDRMVSFEAGKADYRKVSDIDLCTELDKLANERYGRHSVYQLTEREKQLIALELHRTRHLSEAQIRRCLAMFYPF